MDAIGDSAEKLDGRMGRAGASIEKMAKLVTSNVAKMSAAILVAANSGAVLSGLGGVLGTVTKAAGGFIPMIGIVRNAGMAFGHLPSNTNGFPTIVKRAIQVAAAVRLFSASTKILSNFASRIPLLAGLAPHLRNIGDGATRGAGPLLAFARAALLVGSVIGATKTVTQLAKGITLVSGAAAALGGAIFLITGLAQAISQLAGVAGLLPAALVGLGVVMGTIKLSTKGMGDAFKAVASGDAAALDKAMKNLAPSARQFVSEIKKVFPAFKEMQLDVQQQLFEGLGKYIQPLANQYLPMLRTTLRGVAADFNYAAQKTAQFMQQGDTANSVAMMLSDTRKWIFNLIRTLPALTSVFVDLATVGSGVLVDMTKNSQSLAERFAKFVSEARESGKLGEWMRNGVQAVKDLGAIVRDVGVSLKLIFVGINGSDGAGFLAMIREGTTAMRAFLESSQGQEKLRALGEFLGGAMARWMAIFEAAWRALEGPVTTMIPVFTDIANAMSTGLIVALAVLGPMLQGLADTLAFLSPVLAPIIGTLLGFGIAVKGLMLIFGVFGKALQFLIIGFKAVGIAWKVLQFLFLGNPWVALISFIVLLVVLIITNWDTIKGYLETAWNWIKNTAETVWNAIVAFFGTVIDGIVYWFENFTLPGLLIQYWDEIWATIQSVWNGISDFFGGLWQGIVDLGATIWGGIVGFFAGIWEAIKAPLAAAWEVIKTIIQTAWEVIWNIFRYSAAILLAIFFTIFGPLIDFLIAAWAPVSQFFVDLWNGIVELTTTQWNNLVNFLTGLWNGIVETATMIWNILSTAVTQANQAIMDFIMPIWDAIVAFLTGFWNNLVQQATDFWNLLSSAVTQANQAISDFIMPIWNAIISFLTGLWNSIVNAATTAWNILMTAVNQANTAIKNFIMPIWNSIVSFFTGIWNNIVNAVSAGARNVMNAITNIWNSITNQARNAINLLVDAGRNIVQGLWNGIVSLGGWLTDQIMGWIRRVVPGPILQFLGIASPSKWMRDEIGKNIPAGIMVGIEGMSGKLIATARNMAQNVAKASAIKTDDLVTPAVKNLATVSWTTPDGGSAGFQVQSNGAVTRTGGGATPPSVTPVGSDGAASTPTTTIIENLTLQVAGNLDPTDPLKWRQGIRNIKEGIRQVDKSEKVGS